MEFRKWGRKSNNLSEKCSLGDSNSLWVVAWQVRLCVGKVPSEIGASYFELVVRRYKKRSVGIKEVIKN